MNKDLAFTDQVMNVVGVGDLRSPEGISVILMTKSVVESLSFPSVSVPGKGLKDFVGLVKPGER